MYGLADGNALEARRLYQERYLTCKLPDRKTFEGIHRRLSEHRSFARPKSTTLEEEEDVLSAVDQSPGVSTRRLRLQRYVPHMTIWRLLRGQLYTYHLQRVPYEPCLLRIILQE
jgi:hypothetical protein